MGSNQTRTLWTITFVASATLFFLGAMTLWLAGNGSMFVSPDETANAWFIHVFSQTGEIRWLEPMNASLDNAIHPRSMIVLNGWTLPIGFLGLTTLYGVVVRLLGAWTLPFLTSGIALLAVFAWRRLLRRWFDEPIANTATMILLFHPAFWYYTARGLMPNVLFVSLVILAMYFWFERPWHRWIACAIAGCFLGLALFVRASEVSWIVLVVLVLGMLFWRSLEKKEIVFFLIGGFIGLAPFFLMNNLTYGDAFVTGYTLPVAIEPIAVESQTNATRGWLFPFGIEPRTFIRTIVDYGLVLFWWLSIPAVLGYVLLLFEVKNKTKPRPTLTGQSRPVLSANPSNLTIKVYLALFFGLAVWLGVWYGSWVIHDNPDPTQVTIANSYVRYWLPLFVLSTPFVAVGLLWINNRLKEKVLPLLLLAIIVLGFHATFVTGQDGLMQVARILARSADIRLDVLSRIEPDSLIIVDRADKLFFPHRVIYPLRSEKTYALLPRIVELVPLYYYGITFPQTDLTYLNERTLKELGLSIQSIQTFDEESLYRIRKS